MVVIVNVLIFLQVHSHLADGYFQATDNFEISHESCLLCLVEYGPLVHHCGVTSRHRWCLGLEAQYFTASIIDKDRQYSILHNIEVGWRKLAKDKWPHKFFYFLFLILASHDAVAQWLLVMTRGVLKYWPSRKCHSHLISNTIIWRRRYFQFWQIKRTCFGMWKVLDILVIQNKGGKGNRAQGITLILVSEWRVVRGNKVYVITITYNCFHN